MTVQKCHRFKHLKIVTQLDCRLEETEVGEINNCPEMPQIQALRNSYTV